MSLETIDQEQSITPKNSIKRQINNTESEMSKLILLETKIYNKKDIQKILEDINEINNFYKYIEKYEEIKDILNNLWNDIHYKMILNAFINKADELINK